MKLKSENSQLLIIDVQERLAPVMFEMDKMVKNTSIVLEAATHLKIPVLISEQYKKGLGETLKELRKNGPNIVLMEKMHFSCWEDEKIKIHLSDNLNSGKNQFVLVGIEAHICVTQTALDLKTTGKEVFVIADCVTSRKPSSVDLALKRMRAAGCHVINTEMALFEWLNISGTDDFKKISKLIK